MLRGRTTGIAIVFGVAAAVMVTAGCGGGTVTQHSALPVDPVAAAAAKSQNAGAARIRFSMAISGGQAQGKVLRMRGVGAIDGASSEMTFSLGSMLGKMGMPATAMKKFAHASMKAIALKENGDFVMYMNLGFLPSQMTGGKQWMKLDFSKLGKSAGYGNLFSESQFEPGGMLGMLKAEGATVHNVGAATIGGVATTHYRVTIDLAKALQSKGVSSPLLKGLAAQSKTATDDVWIGTDGLVRRIQAAYSMPSVTGSPSVSMTMNIYDYGANVTIAAPPSSEVFDGTQLAQQGVNSSLP